MQVPAHQELVDALQLTQREQRWQEPEGERRLIEPLANDPRGAVREPAMARGKHWERVEREPRGSRSDGRRAGAEREEGDDADGEISMTRMPASVARCAGLLDERGRGAKECAGDPRAGTVYEVEKLSGGLTVDVWPRGPVAFAIGGLASLSRLPDELDVVYGKNPISGMVFLRAVLR